MIRPYPRVLRVVSKSLFLPWEPQFSTKWAKTQKNPIFYLYLYFLENRFFNQNHIVGYFVLWLKHYFCPGNHKCPQNKLKLKTCFYLYLHFWIGVLIRPRPRVLCVRTKTLFLPVEPQFSTDWAKIQTFFVFCLCF